MPEYVYALHDFTPENPDEVPFKAGDKIEVVEKDDMYQDGWWQVSIAVQPVPLPECERVGQSSGDLSLSSQTKSFGSSVATGGRMNSACRYICVSFTILRTVRDSLGRRTALSALSPNLHALCIMFSLSWVLSEAMLWVGCMLFTLSPAAV